MASVETVDLWAKIGLGVAGAGALALFVSDVTKTPGDNLPALPLPFHDLSVLAVTCVIATAVMMKMSVWLARRQQRFVEQLMAELRSAAPAAETLPDNVQAFELGRRVERQNGHR